MRKKARMSTAMPATLKTPATAPVLWKNPLLLVSLWEASEATGATGVDESTEVTVVVLVVTGGAPAGLVGMVVVGACVGRILPGWVGIKLGLPLLLMVALGETGLPGMLEGLGVLPGPGLPPPGPWEGGVEAVEGAPPAPGGVVVGAGVAGGLEGGVGGIVIVVVVVGSCGVVVDCAGPLDDDESFCLFNNLCLDTMSNDIVEYSR